jgi:hypothetical protein
MYQNYLQKKAKKEWFDKNMVQLCLLASIVAACVKTQLRTPRQYWTYFFSAFCDRYKDKAIDFALITGTTPHLGCGYCRGCQNRFYQAIICIRTCQGLGDKNTVPHWHYVFHHLEPFNSFSLSDWAAIEPTVLAGLAYR